jgi:hypothetical protein
LNLAAVQVSRIGTSDDTLLAYFGTFPLNSLIRSYGGSFGPSIGSCIAYEFEGGSLVLGDPMQPTYLDAGLSLAITGPGGTKTISATSTGLYPATLGTASSRYITPGAYSAVGSGGAAVGPFNWSITAPTPVVPTNIPSSVNRSQNLTLAWTGGSAFPGGVVSIFAYNGLLVTGSLSSYVDILCTADASAGTFTIPSAILNLLPTNGYGTVTQPGVNIQIAGIPENVYSVAGSPGIDAGLFTVWVSNGSVAAIQ